MLKEVLNMVGENYIKNNENPVTTQMTVYKALNKRKIYLNQLERLKDQYGDTRKYLAVVSGNATTVDGLSIEKFENAAKALYDKKVAILRNFYALNAAITKSNATTVVTIAGVEYTVAEAIVRYDRLSAEKDMLVDIRTQVVNAKATINKYNTDVLSERNVTEHVRKSIDSLGMTTDNTTPELIEMMEERYRAEYIQRNTYRLVDPYNHAETIENRIDELNAFISEFNEAINICNMQTIINVNLVND